MSKKKMNLFIVEDNNVFNKALKADIENTFANIPVNIHSFENGESCMKEFLVLKPEIVILDYNLNSKQPNAVNGIKVLDWIKSKNPFTNVIMLTSEDDLDIALKSFHHGASDYIVKTETKFKKINYSLFNLFKILESRDEARWYKFVSIAMAISIVVITSGVVLMQYFNPGLFN